MNHSVLTINREEIGDFEYILYHGPYPYRVYAPSLAEAKEMLADYLD